MKQIPFVDLNRTHGKLKSNILKSIEKIIDNNSFIGGEEIKIFEKKFSEIIENKNCIAVANGTDSIYIILKSLNIGFGDEVITVANTWISTSETITQTGANPIFVDPDPEYLTIDVTKIEEKITNKTKAIIAVHLFGQSCKLKELKAICEKHNLFLIEDCAQSHLTTYEGKIVGNFGVASSFSFYPGKNLGAFGDAGCIITNDDNVAKKCRMFANHGALIKHHHQIEGVNSRMDTIQASVLLNKLPYLKEYTESRRNIASLYHDRLRELSQIITPSILENSEHSFHLFVIQVKNRSALIDFLKSKKIATGIHYPTPLPFLKAYERLEVKPEDFPVAFHLQHKILSLPIFPGMTIEEVEYVCESIKEFYS